MTLLERGAPWHLFFNQPILKYQRGSFLPRRASRSIFRSVLPRYFFKPEMSRVFCDFICQYHSKLEFWFGFTICAKFVGFITKSHFLKSSHARANTKSRAIFSLLSFLVNEYAALKVFQQKFAGFYGGNSGFFKVFHVARNYKIKT